MGWAVRSRRVRPPTETRHYQTIVTRIAAQRSIRRLGPVATSGNLLQFLDHATNLGLDNRYVRYSELS
jgi:hypothetical protein